MGFGDRVDAAKALQRAAREEASRASASVDAATVAAQEAAARLLAEVLEAEAALARARAVPAPPDHLDPEQRIGLRAKEHRRGPIVLEAKDIRIPTVKARFEYRKSGGFRASWSHRFVGWAIDLGGGLGASKTVHADHGVAKVEFLVRGPIDAGVGGRFTPQELAQRGRIVWEGGSGKEFSWSAGQITAEQCFRPFLDIAAVLVAREA